MTAAPTLRDLLLRYPQAVRPRFHQAVAFSQVPRFAPAVAALAVLRGLLAENVPQTFDVRVRAAEQALRLGLPHVAAMLLDVKWTASEAHGRIRADLLLRAGAAQPAFVDALPAAGAIARLAARTVIESAERSVVCGPTAALFATRTDVPPHRYRVDIDEGVALLSSGIDVGAAVLCEAHLPMQAQVAFCTAAAARRAQHITIVLPDGEMPVPLDGYDATVDVHTVAGQNVSLGDASAWNHPIGTAPQAQDTLKTVRVVEWRRT